MWHYFNLITYISVALWLLSGTLIYSKSKALRNLSITAHLVATLTIGVFIVALWQNLDRPPLRTLAETRIWYAFFMGLIGCAIYWLYRQKWMLSYSAVMGIVFIVLTYTHPDTMNKALMPALQSVWFIPHVIVYIFAYAMKRGDTIGRGTLKKLGHLSLGLAIWYISTTNTITKKRNLFRVSLS